jgi:hypothetical protein
MPRGDGTGPLGLGPITGRAAGFSSGYAVPEFANPLGGLRFCGRERGRRFGRGFGYAAPVATAYPVFRAPEVIPGVHFPPAAASVEAEMNALKAQAEQLKQTLEKITRRLEEMEGVKNESTE